MLGGRRRARQFAPAPPARALPSPGAEATPPPLAAQLKDPLTPLCPPLCCTESCRARAGSHSSLVSQPILSPVLCQSLCCFPTQGVGLSPHPAAKIMGDDVWFFCHSDEVFIATIALQTTNFTDLSPIFRNNGRGSTASSSVARNGGGSRHKAGDLHAGDHLPLSPMDTLGLGLCPDPTCDGSNIPMAAGW